MADLYLDGYLADDGGLAKPTAGRREPPAPVLSEVWQRIVDGRPHRWQRLVRQRRIEDLTRDVLGTRWIRVERPPRILRQARISVRDPRALAELHGLVTTTLRGPTPVSRLPERDTMLVALLAQAQVRTILPRNRRREFGRRIDEMIVRGGPPVAGLHQAIRRARLERSGGG